MRNVPLKKRKRAIKELARQSAIDTWSRGFRVPTLYDEVTTCRSDAQLKWWMRYFLRVPPHQLTGALNIWDREFLRVWKTLTGGTRYGL